MIKDKLILGYMPQGTGAVFPFHSSFDSGVDITRFGFDGVDALVLWGGEDIAPSYYAQPANKHTQNKTGPTSRDKQEWKAMTYARMKGIPIIGVCRGAQFLCVFAGGKLIQHTNGHHKNHRVTLLDTGEITETSSCHHQMMYPYGTSHVMMAYSTDRLSTTYQDGENKEMPECKTQPEPEVVFFPKVKGLAIQGHPEWMDDTSPFVLWCNRQVQALLLRDKMPAATVESCL